MEANLFGDRGLGGNLPANTAPSGGGDNDGSGATRAPQHHLTIEALDNPRSLIVHPRPHIPTATAPTVSDVWIPPTPDLYLNTALEVPRSPPRPTRPHGSNTRRIRPAHFNTAFTIIRMEAHNQVQAGAHAGENASADRRAARLNAWRLGEPTLVAAFQAALQQYKLDDLPASQHFEAHMQDAAFAAKTAVRTHGIMLWFPKLPKEVDTTLTALVSFYHGEARQMVDLYRKEGQGGSWNSAADLHPEIIHAATRTSVHFVDASSMEVTRFAPFGSSEKDPTPIKCPGFITEHFVDESHLCADLARVVATCRVARVYLNSKVALRSAKDYRWEDARQALIKLCAQTSVLLRNALHWVNKPGVEEATMVLFGNVVKEIKEIGIDAQTDVLLVKIARGRLLAKMYEHTAGLLAEAIEEETDEVGALSDECEEMAGELLELEDGPCGTGPLFGAWRDIQMS